MPISNAEKCRSYRIRKHDREMILAFVRDTINATIRDTIPLIVQEVIRVMPTPMPIPSINDTINDTVRDTLRDMIPLIAQEVSKIIETPVSTPEPTPSLNGFPSEVSSALLPNFLSLTPSPLSSPKGEYTPPKGLVRSLDAEFDETVWSLFPRKVGKGQARKAYRAARKQASFDRIVAGIRAHLIECQTTEVRFIPHPATWLNGQRWLDEELLPNGHLEETDADDWKRNPDGSYTADYELARQEARRRLLAEPRALGSNGGEDQSKLEDIKRNRI